MSLKTHQSSKSRTELDQEWESLIFPSDYKNPTPQDKYHLVVIGAGPAGLVAAVGAAGLGAKVALIESHAMGGDCLNLGCVPSKALLSAGKQVKAGKLSSAQAIDWVHEVRTEISPHDSVERFTDLGVDVFLGHGQFTDSKHVEVIREGHETKTLTAKAFVIATGSQPFVPPIKGHDTVNILTNETIFDLPEAPKSLAVLGGGPIGCELAQAFADMGTEVHLFEMADQVLIREHPEAAALVAESLKQSGVTLHLGAAASELENVDGKVRLTADGKTFDTDEILFAVGRKANFEKLQLDKAGVTTHKRGITVDKHYRTSQKHIFAIGDVSSKLQFTSFADSQARAVIQNALFPGNSSANVDLLPWCTYTKPEIAGMGLSEKDAQEQGIAYDVYRYDWKDSDRAKSEDDKVGFAQVITKKGADKIIGATIVGSDAGDQIAPISVMVSNDIGLGSLGKTLFCYPSRSEYLKRLSDAYNKTRLTPTVAKLMKKWLDWTL